MTQPKPGTEVVLIGGAADARRVEWNPVGGVMIIRVRKPTPGLCAPDGRISEEYEDIQTVYKLCTIRASGRNLKFGIKVGMDEATAIQMLIDGYRKSP